MNAVVLRLGHRYARDARLSTHLALTARAFGASRIVYDVADSAVKASVERINAEWGGGFEVEHTRSWRKFVSEYPGVRVHLTMYGLPLEEVIPRITGANDVLMIVGGAKVPSDVYGLVDYNVSVGGQPHSEVAALAVFLDRLQGGSQLRWDFKGRKRVIPQERGKRVVESP